MRGSTFMLKDKVKI